MKYVNFELDIVLIENTDIVTSSPFAGTEEGFPNPNPDDPDRFTE